MMLSVLHSMSDFQFVYSKVSEVLNIFTCHNFEMQDRHDEQKLQQVRTPSFCSEPPISQRNA